MPFWFTFILPFTSQETILFHRSLRENITYPLKGKPVEEMEILKALDASFANKIISRIPGGLDAHLSDRGDNISGGEKQRICIARELMKNTDIFIFDEATSALDSISENVIQKTIQILSKSKTVIIIAHRMSTIQNADMIYVLDDGKIKENGNHESLMSNKGLYYTLYTEQKNQLKEEN
ncbi:ATP-binding cassette domain-containing protein [Pectinatus cerevisiiphilus]|nr:ATP-binding cassette domain-containing protein [Pectinatus cerevisiiphilus]